MSYLRKMKRFAIVASLLAGLSGIQPCMAMAQSRPDGNPIPAIETCANTADSTFSFSMNFRGATSATGFRPKDNSSSVYVYVTKCAGSPRMFIDGAKNANGAGAQDCTATTYHANKVGHFRMRSYVYERGFRRARLTAWAERGPAIVRGLWSPDSMRSYPEMPH